MIDPESNNTWGKFLPVLINSKPAASSVKNWTIQNSDNQILKNLPEECDAGGNWLQSNSRALSKGWVDVPVNFADGAPMVAIRWDLPAILIGLGFNIDQGSGVLTRLFVNAMSLKKTKLVTPAEKAKKPSETNGKFIKIDSRTSKSVVQSPFKR